MNNLPPIRYSGLELEQVNKRLREISERLAKVSPYPWVWHWGNGSANISIRDITKAQGWRRGLHNVCYMAIAAIQHKVATPDHADNYTAEFEQTKADAEFITSAPEDIHFLISEIDGLRRDIEFIEVGGGTMIDDLQLQIELAWAVMTEDQKDRVAKQLNEYRSNEQIATR